MSNEGPKLRKVLGSFHLTLLLVVAVVNINLVPLIAKGGIGVTSLWVLAFLFFLIPQAIAVLELSTQLPQEGGLYVWTKEAFGDFHGFLSGWCYWTNNLVYVPALLLVIVKTVLYTGSDPQVTGVTTFAATILLLWFIVLLNVLGLDLGKWLQTVGGFATFASVAILVTLSVFFLSSNPNVNGITLRSMSPSIDSLQSMKTLGYVCFALVGLELGSIMAGEIKSPERNIRRAIYVAGPCCLLLYMAATLGVQVVIPIDKINEEIGLVQALDAPLRNLQHGWALPILKAIVVVSVAGALSAWLGGPARIPFVIGIDRILPFSFAKIHPRYQTPYIAILIEGLISTMIFAVYWLGSTGKETFRLLLQTATAIQLVCFLYLFAAIVWVRLGRKPSNGRQVFFANPWVCFVAGGIGFITTAVGMLLQFIPEKFEGWRTKELMVAVGCAGFLLTAVFVYFLKRRRG